MPLLTLKIFVVILAVPAIIHIIRQWVTRRKGQKRTEALKGWIQKQDKPPAVIYRKVQIRLGYSRESD